MKERWWSLGLALAVLAGAFAFTQDSDRTATGQGIRAIGRRLVRMPSRSGEEDEVVDGVFLPPDRTAKRKLAAAEEMIGERRYGESVRFLGSLLEGSEDFFLRPESAGTVDRSLKAEAGRLIAGLPADGRESYELQFGAKARRMLDGAVATGNVADLAEVSRRFFYTQAGSEASLLLARQNLDAGQPLAAALLFARLHDSPDLAKRFEPTLSLYLATAWLRAGMRDQAQSVLLALKRESPAQVRIAGQTVKLFDADSQALAWLEKQVGRSREIHRVEGDDWLMYRGDVRHNASSRGGRPLLNPRWRVRVAHHPTIERRVKELRQHYADEQDVALLPSLHPLAVGNLVLVRDSRSLLAIDFRTGKLVWPAEPLGESALDHWLSFSAQPQPAGQMQLAQFVEQRFWDDPTYGTMSSDGQQVFIIEDPVGTLGKQPMIMRAGWRPQPNGGPRTVNLLIARELKTEGKLKWEVGGASGEDEPKLAGAFFLGPPLVLQDRLYALAEMKGLEIRLVALSAKTGKLDWSQQLCVVDPSSQEPDRRAGGASPSFADGVLVCPTSAGAIVAVDSTTRNLLWGYQYPQAPINPNHINVIRNTFPLMRRVGDRWADGTVTVADGKVVVTPIDSGYLYVLNLINGEVLWKMERGNNLYVAGIHGGNVIVVGRTEIHAYPLSGGEPAWTCATRTLDQMPGGGIPSGRGFLAGNDYYLPLATGEVIQIDLARGEVASRAKSRSGDVPGNLICHRGQIISQGSDYVEVFDQRDLLEQQVAEKLGQAPDDAKSLARLGEIKFDEDHLQEAIDLFRRSFDLSPDDHTRGLLVGSLLEGLRRDFAANRGKAAELEQLIDQQSDRNAYLRLVAVGLKQSGESLAAYDAYVSLLNQPKDPANHDALEPAGEGLRVRRQRWIESELGDLRARAAPADVAQIDERVAARLQSAIDAGSIDALEQFLDVFGTHPAAAAARERLVSKLSGAPSLIQRELLLRRLAQSPDEAQARAAVVHLAALFDEALRPDLSVFYYRQLRDGWADIPCLDGKTGAELVAALPVDAPVRKLLATSTAWPVGVVTAKEGGPRSLGNNRHQRSFVLNSYGPVAPYFADMTIALDQQQSIVGHDGLGAERFKAQLSEPNPHQGYWNGSGFNNIPMLNYVRSNGNLLVMWTGQHVLAVDTLRPGSNLKRILWDPKPLAETIPGLPMQGGYHQTPLNAPWGGLPPRLVAQDAYNHLIGNMGPVNFDGLCFQHCRNFNCIDPLTGNLLWVRKNVPVGCDIFGDEELLFVAPPEGGDALVLRALDGQLLGKRPVGLLRQRMTTIGRATLVWEAAAASQVVTMRDAWSGEVKWSCAFSPGAKGTVVADEALGVLEPSGRFLLVRLADGRKLVEEKLEPERSLTGIGLLRSSDQYLLVTNSPPTSVDQNMNIQPPSGLNNDPLINGRVYAFDRASGQKLWPRPVVLQQQGLVLTQPSELPLLFFFSNRHKNTPAGQPEAKSMVQVVDKRNGRVWFKRDDLPLMITNFELQGDHDANTVTLLLPGTMFTFRLTDEPLPPLAEAPPPPKPGFIGGLGRAILRSIERSTPPVGDLLSGALEQDPFSDGDDD